MKRRSFFSSLLAAPAVAVAVASSNHSNSSNSSAVAKTEPKPAPVQIGKPPVLREPLTQQLIEDAFVQLGLLRPGESPCTEDRELAIRVLSDYGLSGPYHQRAALAAGVLAPYYYPKFYPLPSV